MFSEDNADDDAFENFFEEENEEEKTSKYVQKEHGDFRFSRKFGLPQKIIRKRVSAKLKNGILTVTLPKMKLIPQPSSQIIID